MERFEEAERGASGLSPSGRGVGPLLQRDYWAKLRGTELRPSQIAVELKRHFASYAPAHLAAFAPKVPRALRVGDEMDIHIAGAGDCCVRVVHCDEQSVTLATVEGHPEAGRITFGAYRDVDGRVIFHIRSRARSDSLLRRLGFVLLGDAMQTNTWTDFVSRVAALCGSEVAGGVHVETNPIDDEHDGPIDRPTFLARGD
jgi:Domain of unknown function (DUF1990)